MSTRGLQQRDGNTPQKRRKAKKSKGPARNGAKSRVKGKRRRPCLLAPCSASASVLVQPLLPHIHTSVLASASQNVGAAPRAKVQTS